MGKYHRGQYAVDNGLGWYKSETVNGTYFASAGEPLKIFRTFPDAESLAAYLNEIPEAHIEDYFNRIAYEYLKTTKVEPQELPAGVYSHSPETYTAPEKLIPLELREDTYIKLDSHFKPIEEDVKSFLDNEAQYREDGSIYKRGILMYGPPGQGKTSLIRTIVRELLPKDAVVIFCEVVPSREMILKMKNTLPNRLKVFIFEELANIVERPKIERMLDFLDGEQSLDRALVFATTNYPERLPGNLVDRPSRFDRIVKLGVPTRNERGLLINHYMGIDPSAADLTATESMSSSAIKEAAQMAKRKKITLMAATLAIKAHTKLVKSEFAEAKVMGLRSSSAGEDFGDEDD